MKSKVAVVRVRPESILDDIGKLCGLAGMRDTLDASATTILKDNISWHFPFPAANTTPWQLEGTILALRAAGYEDLTCVQNRTVVTDAFKGEDLNRYIPVLKHYRVPILYNFKSGDMKWVEYKPKARMRVLDKIYPDGIRLPDYFFGKNIVHLPTVKCVSGETRIVLSDGSRLTMRELVDRQFERAPYAVVDRDGDTRVSGRVELMAMDDTGHIVPCPAKWFWRTGASGRPVLQLRTRTGRTLTASSDHRVRTPEGWTPLGNLAPGDRVAIARRVASDGASQPLPQTEAAVEIPAIAAQAGRTYSQTLSQEVLDAYRGGATVTAVARATELPWHKVNYILKRHGVPLRRNRNRLRIPARTSVDFWRWIGYVIAEGCIERGKTSDKLWWVNGEASIRDDFITLTRRLFGLEARRSTDERKRYVYGRSLGRFFEEIGLPVPLHSGNKIVPEMLFRCPDDEIAAFLSGYLDGDGSVSKKQAEISATTKSRELALDLQALLARLGVIAFVRPVRPTIPGRWLEPRTYYMITASGHDFAVLAKHLSFRHPQK